MALSDVCGCRHSHLTLPQWRADVMGSSQALIWQGIPAFESKEVTAVWGGSQCTGEITELQRQASALSIPSSSFTIYQGIHSAPCPLRAADVTVHQNRKGDASQHMQTRTYLAPSNVHVIFRKTLLTAESWDCRQWWEQPILHKQAFNRRSSKGERKRIFKEWSWYQDTVECCIEGVLSFFFPRGEVKKADAKPYSSSITRKKLNCSENSFVSGRLV